MPPTLRDKLAVLPPQARPAEKARAIAQAFPNPHTFERDGQRFTVHEWRFDPATEMLEAVVTAKPNQGAPALAITNPLQFKNPPIMVPDGTTHTVLIDGGLAQVTNFTEDVGAAAETMVAEAAQASDRLVRRTAKEKGVSVAEVLLGDPTLTVYASTADGYVQAIASNVNATTAYNSARGGAGLTADTAGGDLYIGQLREGNQTSLRETFLEFDTSGVPDGATITGVEHSQYGSINTAFAAGFTIDLLAGYDHGSSVTTGDWRTGAQLAALTVLGTFATGAAGANFTTSGYNVYAENGSNFRSHISKTGVTRFMVVSDRQVVGNVVTAEERVLVKSADTSGTTQDPKLVITYAPTTVAVGQTTETDTAQAVSIRRTVPGPQAAETDTAQAIAASHLVAVGQAVETDTAGEVETPAATTVDVEQSQETDTAPAVTPSHLVGAGQALETDAAGVVTPSRAVAVEVALEADTAGAVTPSHRGAVEQAAETDTAGGVAPVRVVPVATALEADTAGAITPQATEAVEPAEETDTAGAITPAHLVAVGTAEETDTAGPVGAPVVEGAGQAFEQDTAGSVAPVHVVAVGQAVESNTAGTVAAQHTVALGQAEETDTAQPAGAARVVGVGQALEIDAALGTVPVHVVGVGQAGELDTALDVADVLALTVLVGLATETDTAGAVLITQDVNLRRCDPEEPTDDRRAVASVPGGDRREVAGDADTLRRAVAAVPVGDRREASGAGSSRRCDP